MFNIPQRAEVERSALSSLLVASESRTILIGYLNAYDPIWDSPTTTSLGSKLINVSDNPDPVVMITMVITRINLSTEITNARMVSTLGLTIASKHIRNRMVTHVTDHRLGSDHFIIISKFFNKTDKIAMHDLAWSFHRADCTNYEALVHELNPPIGAASTQKK